MTHAVWDFDWAATSIGPQAQWPVALRVAVDIMRDSAAQIIIFAGPDHLAIYNAAFAVVLGDLHPMAFGQPARLGGEALWAELGPLLSHVRETGETVSFSDHAFRIRRNGAEEDVHFDLSYSPIRDSDGSVCGIFGIVSDTTRRLREEKALARSEAQLRALKAQAHVGIVVADPDRRIRAVNAYFTAMTGYTLDDLRDLRLCDVMHAPDNAPDGREEQLRCKDGRVIWVSRSDGEIYDDAGRLSQIGMIFSDVTARRAQEADMRRLAAIIASSDDAIVGTDLDMRITSWNEGATRLYGYGVEAVIGQSVLMLVPEDRQWEEQRILERIRAGGRVDSHETVRRHRDGHLIDISLTVSPIVDEYGAVVGASKIARSLSERRMAEKMQRVLVDEMKHRVKNILATVHAIARQTFGHLKTPETEAFEARLFALSRAQDLITRESHDGVSLRHLIREVLAPYQGGRVTAEGPDIDLSPRAALSMTLGLHELATNAAKYGALSVPEGRVAIGWRIDDATPPVFTLDWRESGGPPVSPPARRGFGSNLVRLVVPAELGGEALLEHDPAGLRWQVTAPLGAWGHVPAPKPAKAPDLLAETP